MHVHIAVRHVAILAALCLTPRALTAAGEARLTSHEGVVEYQRGEDPAHAWKTAAKGLTLLSGDFLRTGSNGRAILSSGDGTVHILNPNTLFQVGARLGPSQPSEGAATGPKNLRPTGVSADRWLPLGSGAGIALSAESFLPSSTMEGTLYIWHGEEWVRIYLTSPPSNPRQVVPAK